MFWSYEASHEGTSGYSFMTCRASKRNSLQPVVLLSTRLSEQALISSPPAQGTLAAQSNHNPQGTGSASVTKRPYSTVAGKWQRVLLFLLLHKGQWMVQGKWVARWPGAWAASSGQLLWKLLTQDGRVPASAGLVAEISKELKGRCKFRNKKTIV